MELGLVGTAFFFPHNFMLEVRILAKLKEEEEEEECEDLVLV